MSFLPTNEAGFRALDSRCASPQSSASKRLVAQLSDGGQALKDPFLILSVEWSLSNLTRCVLVAGASADFRPEGALGRTMLVQAILNGNLRIVKQLLEAGADHSVTNSKGITALFTAAAIFPEGIELLLDAGADANKAGPLGVTPLMEAIMHRQTDSVKALLPASDLSIKNLAGQNAFHICVLHGNDECFELLLPHVSDVDVRIEQGVYASGEPVPCWDATALRLACQQGKQQMARALLKRGADRVARDSELATPLHLASVQGHLSCVVLLVGQPGRYKMTPAEVDAADVMGVTALHHAAQNGHNKICGVLIEAGARLDAKTSEGFTPLMIALQEQPANAALLALLSGAGPAQPPGTVCDHCGKTAAQASVISLKACSQCHAVRYCGVECSVAAWPGHKAACKARAAEREAKTKPRFIN